MRAGDRTPGPRQRFFSLLRPCSPCCARRSSSSMPLRSSTFRRTLSPATRSGRIGSFHAACANGMPHRLATGQGRYGSGKGV